MKKTFFLFIILHAIVVNAQINDFANPDTIFVKYGQIATINPLLNDFDPNGFPLSIDNVFSNDVDILSFNDSIITFRMTDYSLNKVQIMYQLYDTINSINIAGQIRVYPDIVIDTINANDIKAAVYPGNLQFFDVLINNFLTPTVSNHQYYYPSNAQTKTIFSYSLWLGGINSDSDSVHLSAERYRQAGTDYWPGPLSIDGNVSTDSLNAGKWMRTWKVNSDEIQYHIKNYNNSGYVMPEAIQSWPAHGDAELNQAEFLAPFVDVDLDMEYHPENGDYPLIKGDQAIFFIFNDQLSHSETGGTPIGVEVHCMVWAFKNKEEMNALNSTIFYSYKLFNRSSNTYHDFFLGSWTDFDLGYPWDDYVGCNVEQGYYFAYNGMDYDLDYYSNNLGDSTYGYHENIPAQSTCILGGARQDENSLDDHLGGCDESINGVGFDDGVIDNERLGLSYFLYHQNGGPWYTADPQVATEYYQFLNGIWKDNSPMVYGGNAHYLSGGASLYRARFMWPGDSDPCNWGTNGLEPSWDTIWTEETTGNNPNDRRGLGSTGPFTFEAGSIEYLDIALVTAPGDQGKDSKELLQEYVKAIRAEYIKNPEEFGNQYLGEEVLVFEADESISIFPNPTNGNQIYVNLAQEKEAVYFIYNSTSQLVKQGFLVAQKQQEIDISNLPSGWFILEVIQNGKAYRTKLIR